MDIEQQIEEAEMKVLELKKQLPPNYIIKLVADESPENPLEVWDNVIEYHLRKVYNELEGEEIQKLLDDDNYLTALIYRSEHGDVNYSTSMGCKWDSGVTGIAKIHKSRIGEIGMKKVCECEFMKQVDNFLEDYTSYMNGNVFGFRIIDNRTGEEVETNWGAYYGSEWETNGLLEAVRETIGDSEYSFDEYDVRYMI